MLQSGYVLVIAMAFIGTRRLPAGLVEDAHGHGGRSAGIDRRECGTHFWCNISTKASGDELYQVKDAMFVLG